MSQNFPHAMAHSRGARPKVRGAFRPNEAEQQENLCGPSLDIMQQEVENNLKFYENLINENFAPSRDRGAIANDGNSNAGSLGNNLRTWRGFRNAPLVNCAEDNEECLRPPFSRPNQTGLGAGLPNLGIQLPETCAARHQRICNREFTGGKVPVPGQGIGFVQPINQMAWQPRTSNFAELASTFPCPEDRQRLLADQIQATRGSNRLREQPSPPPQAGAGGAAQGQSHHGPDGRDGHPGHHGHHGPDGRDGHPGHHGHHGPDGRDGHPGHHGHHAPPHHLGSESQAPRGVQQAGDEMDDRHHHHHHHQDRQPVERDEKTVSALRHLVQFRRSPSYVKCDKKGSLDFLEVCNQKVEGGAKATNKEFPRIPCLQDHALKDLIACEKQDVESTLYLASDEKKTYKKPCPKQQKAQMSVKALVHAHAGQPCGKEYSPMEHPDPDDISPEVAAAMMFCQEQGIAMVGCPKFAINFLFPEEAKPPFPEKIPPENISVVGPDQGQQEDMIERSATVSAEGVSDSAYTRTMKEKGEDLGPQKSYDVDFAVGQTKREYVLVAQKPQRINRAQFRGGASPSWFPGYFAAFPDEDGTLKLVPSPSRLLHRAWVHSKPVNMPQSDIIVVD